MPGTPLKFSLGLKCSLDIFYFGIPCMFHVLFVKDNDMSKSEFKS